VLRLDFYHRPDSDAFLTTGTRTRAIMTIQMPMAFPHSDTTPPASQLCSTGDRKLAESPSRCAWLRLRLSSGIKHRAGTGQVSSQVHWRPILLIRWRGATRRRTFLRARPVLNMLYYLSITYLEKP
jgi:hypothetical protein